MGAGGEEEDEKKSGGLHPMYFISLRGYPEEMEVRFTPEVQTKLEQMSRETGRPSEELVEDAVLGYFDELANAREMLDRRFDDLESGRVKPIDGEEAYRLLMEKTEARRHRPS